VKKEKATRMLANITKKKDKKYLVTQMLVSYEKSIL